MKWKRISETVITTDVANSDVSTVTVFARSISASCPRHYYSTELIPVIQTHLDQYESVYLGCHLID